MWRSQLMARVIDATYRGRSETFDAFRNMSVFYINLNRSPDRRADMERMLSKHGLIAERHEAVDGKLVNIDDPKYDRILSRLKPHFKETPSRLGHLGCMLSHMGVYRRFLEAGTKYCLIMEDDCTFTCSDFKAEVNRVLEVHGEHMDMLLCGYHIDKDFHPTHETNNLPINYTNGAITVRQFTGLHCYILTRACAERFVEQITAPAWYIDWEISKMCVDGTIRALGVFPPIACQPATHRIHVGNIRHDLHCPNTHETTTNK